MYGTIEVLAPAPPVPIVPAPSGSAELDALLAFAVILMGLVRLRQMTGERAIASPGRWDE